MPFCLLLLLLCLSTACQATQLRVCADNRNVPPLSFIGGMGEAQYLLAQAAGNLQLRLSISYHRPLAAFEIERLLGVRQIDENAMGERAA